VDRLILVSWNTALGSADTVGFIREVQRSRGPYTELVVLLQEVFRGGPEVPRLLASSASFASRLGGADSRGERAEIEDVAARTGLNLYYVPSMRNGDPSGSDEDRGNAILSSLALSELSAVELPFERQRRVAVAATVSGLTLTGRPWRLRVLSAHLDNMVGLRRMWIAGGEFARARQTRALLDHLSDEPAAVIGADLNTWFGFRDRGYLVAASAFPDTRVVDRRATFRGLLRLDHLFFRVPDGWRADFRRAEDDFGSDHYPLVAQLRLPA
jgi:endonuclease/exonuclease/phosphatase family metal-dependent hydrolase